MSKQSISQKEQSIAGLDPVVAVQQVARALPASEPMTSSAREALRVIERRVPAALIALVTSMAEEGDGNVAGVAIDATATRAAMTKVSQLRVGAAAARAVARYLEREALVLASGVAQDALSATTSLEALSRTQAGRGYAEKAAELRAAAKRRRKPAKQGTETGNEATSSKDGAAATKPAVAPATQS